MNGDQNLLDELSADAPMQRMRTRFEESITDSSLPDQEKQHRRPAVWLAWAAVATIVIGGLLALWTRSMAPNALDVRVRAALEMLESNSSFDRLRGVNAAAELPGSGSLLRVALLDLLERDESVNVRLQALAVLVDQDLPADRLVTALTSQQTAIVQAHLGYQLRRRHLLSRDEMAALLGHPEIHEDARNVLNRLEEL